MPHPRNILVIGCRGLRVDAFGEAGLWPIVTPHLDNLVDHGLAFNAVAASPGADPAWVSLLSGLHVRQHGLVDDHQNLPRIGGWLGTLRAGGYHTVGVGQLGPVARQLDEMRIVGPLTQTTGGSCEYLRFATKIGVSLPVQAQRRHRMAQGPFGMARGLEEPTHDVDGFIGSTAVSMIERLPRNKPWCMTLGLTGPGNDLPAPQLYEHVLEPDRLTRPFTPADMRSVEQLAWFDYPRHLLQGVDPNEAARIRQHYLARVCMLDAMVGMLRDAIDRHGHAPDTWIVLVSDRGYLLGEHGLYSGTSFLTGQTNTPLWLLPPAGLNRPDAPVDEPEDLLISMVDLAPTLCAIGQVDGRAGWPGRSLLPAVAGEAVGSPLTISEYRQRVMLETMRHKVAFDLEEQAPRLLFDLVTDQQEKRNLIDTPAAANVLDGLRVQMAEALMPLRAVGPRGI